VDYKTGSRAKKIVKNITEREWGREEERKETWKAETF
jgi:hypothetical protein